MKKKRKVWWSEIASSPRELKKWFADRSRDVKPISPPEVIFSRSFETREEFIKRLERIAEQRQRSKKKR
jgi:hypothetical protein